MFCTKICFAEPDYSIKKYQKSFMPFAVSLWNCLNENTRMIINNEFIKDKLIANTNDIIMAKIRILCSSLKGQLYSMKLMISSACSCGFINEDEFHFFLVCPLCNRSSYTSKFYRTHSTLYPKDPVVCK